MAELTLSPLLSSFHYTTNYIMFYVLFIFSSLTNCLSFTLHYTLFYEDVVLGSGVGLRRWLGVRGSSRCPGIAAASVWGVVRLPQNYSKRGANSVISDSWRALH